MQAEEYEIQCEDLKSSKGIADNGTDIAKGIDEKSTFFEKVNYFHENMIQMDDQDFGLALSKLSKQMYKELVGSTAIRKSSKIKEIVIEFEMRMAKITHYDDYVNYTYFLARLSDFDLVNRLDSNQKFQFIQRSLQSTVDNFDQMEFEKTLRSFGDLSQHDPVIALSNKFQQLIQNKDKRINFDNLLRLLKYLQRSKNPRLYVPLAKLAVSNMSQSKEIKTQDIKNVIYVLHTLSLLQNQMYVKFDLIIDLVREISQRGVNLSDSEILKIIETSVSLKFYGQHVLATKMQQLIGKRLQEASSQNPYFILRFWSQFVQVADADKIINEELFKQSLDIISKEFTNQQITEHITERDLRNTLILINFCYDNKFEMRKIIQFANFLTSIYDTISYKLYHFSQEQYLRVMKKLFENDLNKYSDIAEGAIKFLKYESTQIRYLCEGLEIFEILEIVKHENRRDILLKMKNVLQNDEYKNKDLLYMIGLYPNKMKTKAFEQLVELAVQKIVDKNLFSKMDMQIPFIIHMSKSNVASSIKKIAQPILDQFYNSQHNSKILNMLMDYACQNFEIFDSQNHYMILKMLQNQDDLSKAQREILIHYLQRVITQTQQDPEDSNNFYIKDLITEIFDKKLKTYPSMNEHVIEDAKLILEIIPAEKCSYFYEGIVNSLMGKHENGKYHNAKLQLKMAEIITKYYHFDRVSDVILVFAKNMDKLSFFSNIHTIKGLDSSLQLSYLLACVTMNTKNYDNVVITFVRNQVKLLMNNNNANSSFNESTSSTLKRIIGLLMFPQYILNQVHELNDFPIQRIINNNFQRVLPFLIEDILYNLPIKIDPQQNKIAKYFFYGLENNFINRFLKQEQNQSSNAFQSKIKFDQKLLLSIMETLAFKKVNSKLLFQKINQVFNEKRFIDKMGAGELVKLLELQTLNGKTTRDVELCKQIFKKRLPSLIHQIAKNETLNRKLIEVIGNLDLCMISICQHNVFLDQEKNVLCLLENLVFGNHDTEESQEKSEINGKYWIDQAIADKDYEHPYTKYYPQYLTSLMLSDSHQIEQFKPLISGLFSRLNNEDQIWNDKSQFSRLISVWFAQYLKKDALSQDLVLNKQRQEHITAQYHEKLKYNKTLKLVNEAVKHLYPNDQENISFTEIVQDLIPHILFKQTELVLQLQGGPELNMNFCKLEYKVLLQTFGNVAVVDASDLLQLHSLEERCQLVKKVIDNALNRFKELKSEIEEKNSSQL